MRPADPGAGGSDSRVPHERLFSFPCLPPPRVPGSGRRPAFHEAAGTWRMRGPRVGTRHAAAPSSDLGALPSRTVGGGSSVRRPRHRILGGGAWQPPGECPRRAPKPAPPLTRDSLPLLLWRGGGRGPRSKPWKEAGAPGRGAGGGGRLAFALFGVAVLGAALCRRWGPREASRRRRHFGGGLLPSPSGAAGLQLALEGGQARGRGARGAPAAVLGAGSGALMDFTACVSACVCSLRRRRRRRPGPARPVRPPHASEVRVRGPESGGGGGEGAGEGRGGGGAITPSPPPAGSTRAPCGARTTPASRACPRLLLLSCRRRRRRRRLGPAPALRPARRGPGRAAAARRSGRGLCPARAGGGRSAAPEPRARRGGAHAGRRAAPCWAAPCPAGRRRLEEAGGERGAGGGRAGPPAARRESASPRRAWPGVQTGDGWCGGSGSSLAPGSLSGLTPANMQNYRPGRS